jgi:hypothetical protein
MGKNASSKFDRTMASFLVNFSFFELKLSTQLFLLECWGKVTAVHFGVIKLDNI